MENIYTDEFIENKANQYYMHSTNTQSKWFEKGAKWMRDLLKNNDSISCPFCNESGFDKIGLKYHLENYCEIYKQTNYV